MLCASDNTLSLEINKTRELCWPGSVKLANIMYWNTILIAVCLLSTGGTLQISACLGVTTNYCSVRTVLRAAIVFSMCQPRFNSLHTLAHRRNMC